MLDNDPVKSFDLYSRTVDPVPTRLVKEVSVPTNNPADSAAQTSPKFLADFQERSKRNCSKLGRYRMPFAWGAIILMDGNDGINHVTMTPLTPLL